MEFEKLLEEWLAAFTEAAEESLASLENFFTELAEQLATPLEETLHQWEQFWRADEPELDPEHPDHSGETFSTRTVYVSPLGFGGVVVYTYIPYPPGYIGDPTCRYNAHSPELRCAVNPYGPCEGCPHYEKADV
ncbi:MAG: DUF6464 family protein [Thermostichus sp. DG02_2_bins_29]